MKIIAIVALIFAQNFTIADPIGVISISSAPKNEEITISAESKELEQFASQTLIDKIMALRKEVAASQNVDDDKNPILIDDDEAEENFGPIYNETQAIKDLKAQLADPGFHELDVDHKNFLRTELKTLIQEQMRKAREAQMEREGIPLDGRVNL